MLNVQLKRAMIPLSTRTKEAIKTGLAMAIAYGIALYMDWEKPYWAGFAVAMISLSTAGQSLNKGAMRMLGTLVAATAVLTFIALFAQDRWWFIGILSVYLGFCGYMFTGKKRTYFWWCCAHKGTAQGSRQKVKTNIHNLSSLYAL
jgi:uncharacterized membrane protein YccC